MSPSIDPSGPSRSTRPDPYLRWGVPDGPWLWPTPVRILFVLDGRISTSTEPAAFGLGYALKALLDRSFGWWAGVDVEVVRRDDGKKQILSDASTQIVVATRLDFRFTDPGFVIDDYSQIWFFGDYPGPDGIDPAGPAYSQMTDPELVVVADWMDRGGGVFAAGDHYNLGASMCSRIPRVRTMRKWTVAQGVPPEDGPWRNQTLQGEPPGDPDNGESDALEGDNDPQPIEPLFDLTSASPVHRRLVPHPLLSVPTTVTGARWAVIRTFPDHMHEGEVIEGDAVDLDGPLNIAGYSGAEYPFPHLVIEAATAGGTSIYQRPTPYVVAHGWTTNERYLVTERITAGVSVGGASWIQGPKRFALIGAYEGDRVGVGRVVVDSTWHHWFSYNLHGFAAADPPTQFGLMQTYYRNVALWLATPAQRQSMLVAATWGVVVTDTAGFPKDPPRTLWALGEKAVSTISRTASPAMLLDFVKAFIGPAGADLFKLPAGLDSPDPDTSSLSVDVAVRAIVGGIASALIEPATTYRKTEPGKRRLLDSDAIVRHAVEGATRGHQALTDFMRSSANGAAAIATRLTDTFEPLAPESITIPVELVTVRVVAERLQFTDPKDPVLVDGRCTLTARLSLGGVVAGNEVIDGIDLPQFEARGAFLPLDKVLYEGVVQSGESLVVEIVTGDAGQQSVTPDRVRFCDEVGGSPSNWVGAHPPSANQPWRLWYRVEHVGTHKRHQ
jgi:hypothetical protein